MATRKVKVAEPKLRNRKLLSRFRARIFMPPIRKSWFSGEPGRAGTKRHAWFELYSKCKTVGKYLEAGGGRGYLTADVSDGYIEIK